MNIAAGKFKAKYLGIMDDVQRRHETVIITKRGKAVAKLVPVEEQAPQTLFGYLKGHTRITGDIVSDTGEEWEADV